MILQQSISFWLPLCDQEFLKRGFAVRWCVVTGRMGGFHVGASSLSFIRIMSWFPAGAVEGQARPNFHLRWKDGAWHQFVSGHITNRMRFHWFCFKATFNLSAAVCYSSFSATIRYWIKIQYYFKPVSMPGRPSADLGEDDPGSSRVSPFWQT